MVPISAHVALTSSSASRKPSKRLRMEAAVSSFTSEKKAEPWEKSPKYVALEHVNDSLANHAAVLYD